jgi:hypothetical protein
VALWSSVGLWVDSHYTYKDLQPHSGVITAIDSVVTRVKDKPLFKEIQKQLIIKLHNGNQEFTILTTESFGYITTEIGEGDSIILFTKPKLCGIFGLKKDSDINHLIKDNKVIIDYADYKTKISGLYYVTFAFFIISVIVYVIKLRRRLWWDFAGHENARNVD